MIKRHGATLSKTLYDRIGRVTHRFDMAQFSDGGSYAGAFGPVLGTVMREDQTAYASKQNDDVLMTLTIGRLPGNTTTVGPLDSNGDGDPLLVTDANISGRYSIQTSWYDALGRRTDAVSLGNNGKTNYNRSAFTNPPAYSDDELRTHWDFYDDGSLETVTDPKEIKNRFEYDDLGRTTKVVENYVDGVPAVNAPDEDRITRYQYTDGLRTQYEVEASGAGIQTTQYVYGTTKGTGPFDSKIATGHLLSSTQFPGTANTATYAYDAPVAPDA